MTELFLHEPNWESPASESIEFLTGVETAYNGTESRTVLRRMPRRSMSFSFTFESREVQKLNAFLFRHQIEDVFMPVWMDGHRLTVSGNSWVISAPNAKSYDYRAGGSYIVFHGNGTTSVRVIESVEEDTIVGVGDNVVWSVGDRIYPLRLVRLPSSVDFERVTAGVERASITAIFVDDTSLETELLPTTYRGQSVLDWYPNRQSPVASSLTRITDVIDFALGPWRRIARSSRPFVGRTHEYLIEGRQDIMTMRRFLHGLQGRAGIFWAPNWQQDLIPTSVISATTIWIEVNRIDWDVTYDMHGRRDIMIRTQSGNAYFRRIVGSAVLSGDIEQLTMDSALGEILFIEDIAQICWIDIVRLADDTVTFNWLTAGVAVVELAMRGVDEDVAFTPTEPDVFIEVEFQTPNPSSSITPTIT